MRDDSAYRSEELAAIYDAVHDGRDDAHFWLAAASTSGGAILELGSGTGRVLLPLARAGHDVTGIDLSESMLDVCRARLLGEAPEVRARVELVAADMTSFDLGRRFAMVTIPFGSFQHLLTVEQQFACLDRCRAHLQPHGTLVIDLPNPDPAPLSAVHAESADGEAAAEVVEWTAGRRIRWWATMSDAQRSLQCYAFEVTYEVIAADGASRRLSETLLLRYVFRYELEHLLVRAGYRVVALYGDYDRSPFADRSPAMIVVAEPEGDRIEEESCG